MSTTKKKRKKKKKNTINIFVILDIILIAILILFLYNIITNHNKSDNNNNNSNNNNSQNENKKTEKNEKTALLGNINEKIDFFNMDYIDRYIAYKEKHPELDNETIVVYVNIGLDNDYYTNTKDSPNKYTNTVLANKYYYLGDDYVPKDLVDIDKSYASGKKQMTKDAAHAFENMAKDAKKSGFNIRATSTYRSYSYQTTLYNNYAKQDGKKKADTYSARAGYSEHQTGLAVDVDNTKTSYTQFGNTKEFGWMKENAYKYGFILRYTKETESITGYINEPWHYRYVGEEIAKYIHNHPMTYEEYYVRFIENK